jgi:HAE1 family hydrophobic/amphiphilic exporter-1
MVLGVIAITRIPLGAWPLIERPAVRINVPYPGSHPLELLRTVILPLEEEIAMIPGVKGMRSEAERDRAWIEVEFDWNQELDLKKLEVREAVERVRPELPEETGWIRVRTRTGGPGGGGSAALHGRISAKGTDLSESWELLDRRIRRPIERIPGVAQVDLDGVEPQQVKIEVDLDELRQHGVEIRDLRNRLDAENVDLDLGAIRNETLRLGVRAAGRFRDVEEIRGIELRPGVRVEDVARVAIEEPRMTYGRHLDGQFAIGISVFEEPQSNTVEVVDRVMARIDEIQKDPELRGINLLVWNNAGDQIKSSLASLRDAGLVGAVLAVFVLYGFLRRVRTTLVVMVSIPFSLVVACAALYFLGYELNIVTMMGLMLGVGMLVDNAVVVIENIHRREGQGLAPREAARVGVREVFLAVVASTATTVIVWSWLFFADRSEMTILMGACAAAISLSVVCSLVISVTFIPLAASRIAGKQEVREGVLLRRMVPAYRTMIGWTLRHRIVTFTLLGLLAASMVFPFGRIEKNFEPRSQERGVRINYEVYDPATKEVLEGYVDVVEGWLIDNKDELGWENVYSWFSEDRGTMTQVYLPEEKASPQAILDLREKLVGNLPTIAGVKLEVGDRLWWRRGGAGGGRRMVSVSVAGEDPEYLEDVARDVEQRVKGIEDVLEVWGPSLRGTREVRLLIDPERARSVDVEPRAIARSVQLAFRGQRLKRFEGPQGEIEMMLGLPEQAQPGLATLDDLPIARRSGGTVPLSSVADVVLARTPIEIEREDREITEVVSVEFDPDAVTTEEAQARVAAALRTLALPEGYSWGWGRWGRDRDEGQQTMLFGVLVSLIVVLLLMAVLFESLTQPLAILITLPLAFAGAFWAIYLGGYELDVLASMGLVILIGIVVNNGIVMVHHVNALREDGMDRVDALVQGCGDRLRPVLMTAITTISGMIPLAASQATIGGGVFIDSLAVAMIGGLTTSTLLTLVALPVWYTLVEDVGALVARLFPQIRFGRRRSAGVLVDEAASS